MRAITQYMIPHRSSKVYQRRRRRRVTIMETTKVKLTLMIDKRANKVLFAEAGKDFVDFLFNLLSLPIGTLIRLFRNASMFGSIENLYKSLEVLNAAYLQPNQNKNQLLKPHETASVLNPPLLLPEPNPQSMRKFYKCERDRYVIDVPNSRCPSCSSFMNQHLYFVDSNKAKVASEGGIVKSLVTYMVTDDLSVTPVSMISGIDLLQHNVKDISVLERRVVEFGTHEGLELLKNCLQSKTALTNVFLAEKELKDVALSN